MQSFRVVDLLDEYRQALCDVGNGFVSSFVYLLEEQARYALRLNSWQHAMYQALAANHWFVHGGYFAIPQ